MAGISPMLPASFATLNASEVMATPPLALPLLPSIGTNTYLSAAEKAGVVDKA